MTKTMIKTKELRFISIILGIAATLMIFLPALSTGDSDTSYTGLQIALGHEFANLGEFASGEIVFSIFALLAYILPLTAALLLLFRENSHLIATILFGIAMFLLLFIPEFTVVTVTLLGTVTEISIDWTFAIGLFGAIILSGVGLCVGLYTLYKKN